MTFDDDMMHDDDDDEPSCEHGCPVSWDAGLIEDNEDGHMVGTCDVGHGLNWYCPDRGEAEVVEVGGHSFTCPGCQVEWDVDNEKGEPRLFTRVSPE